MESTHDLDFVFWLLEPAKPVKVYSQAPTVTCSR